LFSVSVSVSGSGSGSGSFVNTEIPFWSIFSMRLS
jgi:hypothetical protein